MTNDIMDLLVERLNTIEGIEFVRDAWEKKAPEDYGVVELQGEKEQLWADGHLIDTIWTVVITLYVKGADDTWPEQVQTVLEELEADGLVDLTHRASRSFDYQTGKVCWTWALNLYGDLTDGDPE